MYTTISDEIMNCFGSQ